MTTIVTKKEIEKELINLGISPALKGFRYLSSAIKRCCDDPTYLDMSITKRLYPDIAKENNTTASRAERAIRHAIESMFSNISTSMCREYFSNLVDIDTGKITNSNFIALMTWRLTNREDN